MNFVDTNFSQQTNLDKDCAEYLTNGIWKIGLIKDNPGIDNPTNDQFYTTEKGIDEQEYRCFQNKVNVELYDNSKVYAHIIHWVKSEGWFCVSFHEFWNK